MITLILAPVSIRSVYPLDSIAAKVYWNKYRATETAFLSGITGNVTIDDTGNRKPALAVRGFDFNGEYARLAVIDAWAPKGKASYYLLNALL